MNPELDQILKALERIASALEKLEGKGILVWLGEQKPDEN